MKTKTPQRLEKIKKVVEKRQKNIILVLENLYDPHNISAIARTCDAFGVQDIYCIFKDLKKFNPKRIGKSSSSSANKWITYHKYKNSLECLNFLKKQNYTIISSVLDKKSENFYNFNFSKIEKIALVLGNEHSGISDEVKRNSDFFINIPMQGMVESLNVSVSAGIFISEITRQRLKQKKSQIYLDDYENKRLLEEFLQK